jgi:hypothetical protein
VVVVVSVNELSFYFVLFVSVFEMGLACVAQAGVELMILLPHAFKC